MLEEYKEMMENNTWKLVDYPNNVKPIRWKWVYNAKYKLDGDIEKYKERPVAIGFSQQEGIQYENIFAPSIELKTIRVTL